MKHFEINYNGDTMVARLVMVFYGESVNLLTILAPKHEFDLKNTDLDDMQDFLINNIKQLGYKPYIHQCSKAFIE